MSLIPPSPYSAIPSPQYYKLPYYPNRMAGDGNSYTSPIPSAQSRAYLPNSTMAPIYDSNPVSSSSSTGKNIISAYLNNPGWAASALALGATITSAGLIAYNSLIGKPKQTATTEARNEQAKEASADTLMEEETEAQNEPELSALQTQAETESLEAVSRDQVNHNSSQSNSTASQTATELVKPKTSSPASIYKRLMNTPATIHHAKSVFLPEIPNLLSESSVAFHILQKLFLQSISHKKEDGNIKLFLGAESAVLRDGFSWLGDMLLLLGKPVDVIVYSEIEKTGLSTLVNTGLTGGKAFMMPNALITLHASNNIIDRTQEHFKIQTAKRLSDQSLNSLASLVMKKSGATNRELVLQDLKAMQGNKTWNALQALYYGKSGLIDGILVGHEQVITRSALDRHLKRNNIKTPDQIEDFLKNPINIEKIPTQLVRKAFPASLPVRAGSNYTPMNSSYLMEENTKEKEPVLYTPASKPLLPDKQNTGNGLAAANPSKIKKRMSLNDEDFTSFAVDFPGAKFKSILINDNIFYGEPVTPKLIGKLCDALVALNDKKLQQGSSQHINLYLQSPGGNISSEKMFLNTVPSIETKVNIIAVGLVASAAAGMLSGASGLRLALPQASIMIHEPSLNTMGDMSSEYFEDNAKLIASKTGRPFKEVLEDQKREYYMNPLEALCYGPKGFIDGILVDGQHIITRDGVIAYLVEKMGSKQAAENYIEEKLFQLRNPTTNRNQKLNDKDPFANPVYTIQEVAKRNVKTLGQDKGFLNSGPDLKNAYFEQMNMNDRPQFKIQLKIGGAGN